jgi:hypothetical protein
MSFPNLNPVIPTGEPRFLRLAVEGSWRDRCLTRLTVNHRHPKLHSEPAH